MSFPVSQANMRRRVHPKIPHSFWNIITPYHTLDFQRVWFIYNIICWIYLIPSIVVLSGLQEPWWKVCVSCFAQKGTPADEAGMKWQIQELVDGFVNDQRSKLAKEWEPNLLSFRKPRLTTRDLLGYSACANTCGMFIFRSTVGSTWSKRAKGTKQKVTCSVVVVGKILGCKKRVE